MNKEETIKSARARHMHEAYLRGRREMREEAVKLCEASVYSYFYAPQIAEKIRQLPDEPPEEL